MQRHFVALSSMHGFLQPSACTICALLSLGFQVLVCHIGPATLAVKCQLKPNEFNSSDKFKLAPAETVICFKLLPVMDHEFPNESTMNTFSQKKKFIDLKKCNQLAHVHCRESENKENQKKEIRICLFTFLL